MVLTEKKQSAGASSALKTSNLDHRGIVVALCKDLRIAKRIDERLGVNPDRKISPETAIVAMIINVLGYTNRTLYMSGRFFSSKPVELLLGHGIKAADTTDYTL